MMKYTKDNNFDLTPFLFFSNYIIYNFAKYTQSKAWQQHCSRQVTHLALHGLLPLSYQGINSLFRLSLLDHNTTFEVVPEIVTSSASVLLKVKNQSALDYETVKHMTIHVSPVQCWGSY